MNQTGHDPSINWSPSSGIDDGNTRLCVGLEVDDHEEDDSNIWSVLAYLTRKHPAVKTTFWRPKAAVSKLWSGVILKFFTNTLKSERFGKNVLMSRLLKPADQ